MNGSELIIQCLREHGVDVVFGYPGATNLALYDALYRQQEIRHVLTAHEQGAAHAADGYSRATGRVGVCLATSGPGATNLVTGIATAMMDSIPMVAITCNVTVDSIGKDSFQEVDIFGITLPITKHNFLVRDIADLHGVMDKAFAIASEGRPGPVLIDIAKDVTTAEWTAEMERQYREIPRKTAAKTVYMKDRIPALGEKRSRSMGMRSFRAVLRKAKRPLILAGGGCVASGAEEVLQAFAERTDAPVCETLMGKGAYSGVGERYLGMVGMHGTEAANKALEECDCLIALGVRFSERVTGNRPDWCSNAQILQVDIDTAEINKNIAVRAAIVGDVADVLRELTDGTEPAKHPEWMNRTTERYRKELDEKRRELNDLSDPRLTDHWLALLLDDVTGGNGIITTEVGQHQMEIARHYRVHSPRQLLTSGGLGTMGFGLSAAIGAAFGCPGKRIINVAGDGCFRMNMNELTVVAKYRLPIIEVICDNHGLEMVRHWQHVYYGDRYSQTMFEDRADYVKISEAMGVPAVRVTTREEARKALTSAFYKDGPMVLVCETGN